MKLAAQLGFTLLALLCVGLVFVAQTRIERIEVGVEEPVYQTGYASDMSVDHPYWRAHVEYSAALSVAVREEDRLSKHRNWAAFAALASFLSIIAMEINWRTIFVGVGVKAGETADAISEINEKRRVAKGPSLSHPKGLNSFLVADELAKWRKLLDDGTVTKEEYDAVKSKLLGQSRSGGGSAG